MDNLIEEIIDEKEICKDAIMAVSEALINLSDKVNSINDNIDSIYTIIDTLKNKISKLENNTNLIRHTVLQSITEIDTETNSDFKDIINTDTEIIKQKNIKENKKEIKNSKDIDDVKIKLLKMRRKKK